MAALLSSRRSTRYKRSEGTLGGCSLLPHTSSARCEVLGFAFGPPAHSLARPPPRSSLGVLKSALRSLLEAHVINTLSIMCNPQSRLGGLVTSSHIPLPIPSLLDSSRPLSPHLLLSRRDIPVVVDDSWPIGSQASLALFATNHLLRLILPTSLQPEPFHSREWPPLFKHPSVPRSVTHFWSRQWRTSTQLSKPVSLKPIR